MDQSWKTVRVFISSTFKDMHAERDHLVTVVFPELRERLERLGLDFYDVDLRWGVPETGVDGERTNSWEYCKRWIDRVEPFFVCLLGQRYGWVPPPERIEDQDDRSRYAGLSITEMEVRHAVLTGRLKRRSLFYFRGTRVPDDAPAEVYDRFVDAGSSDRLEALKQEIAANPERPARSYECRWTGSGFDGLEAFGQMVLEDLWSGVLRDPRYVPKDAWHETLGHDPGQDPVYTDESTPIPQAVWDKVVEKAKPEPLDPLDAEAQQMARFAEARLRWFCGRERELGELVAFVSELPPDASRLCVVRGVAGQGKSALLAKFLEELDGLALVISHFVGATERSADVRSVLERLVNELDRNGIPKPEKEAEKWDLDSLKKRLAARLSDYDGERRIILVIDAVNQLTSGQDLAWLPQELGSSVRVVLSCLDDSSTSGAEREPRDANTPMPALRLRRPEPRWVDVAPMAEPDIRRIVIDYLQEYCKELDQEHVDAICRLDQARNPLYLLVMLQELRTLGGDNMRSIVPSIIADLPAKRPDTVKLFDWVLQRLEVFGKEAVRLWFTYLSLGRVGMSSRELSDLLARRLGSEAGPVALRIERGIRRYLQKRSGQWDFFHGQLREAVRQRYPSADAVPLHADIASYLDTRWPDRDAHALSELPYHQTQAGLWSGLLGTLSNFGFLDAKCRVFSPFHLIDDCSLGVERGTAMGPETLRKVKLLHAVWRLSAHILAQDVGHMAGQILGRLPLQAASEFRDLAASVVGARHGRWLRPRLPTLNGPEDTRLVTIVLPGGRGTRRKHPSVALNGTTIAAGMMSELHVWSVADGKKIRKLVGEADEFFVIPMTPDGRRAVSIRNETALWAWDIEQGRRIGCLGEHSGKVLKVVCLSDSRYVASWSEACLKIWDLDGLKEIRAEKAVKSRFYAIAATTDGRLAVSVHYRTVLHIWDTAFPSFHRIFAKSSDDLERIAVSSDGRRAAATSKVPFRTRYARNLWVWDLSRPTAPRRFEAEITRTADIVFQGGAVKQASCMREIHVGVWRVGRLGKLGRRIRRVTSLDLVLPHGWHPSAREVTIDISEAGNYLVVSAEKERHVLWDVAAGQPIDGIVPDDRSVSSIRLMPDNRTLIVAAKEGLVAAWDLRAGMKTAEVRVDEPGPDAVLPLGEGPRVVLVSEQRTATWDIVSGALTFHWTGGILRPRTARLVAEDRFLLVSREGEIVLIALDNGQPPRVLLKGKRETYASLPRNVDIEFLSVTPDGRTVMAVRGDELLTLDIAQGGETYSPRNGFRDATGLFALAPDRCAFFRESHRERKLVVRDLRADTVVREFDADSAWALPGGRSVLLGRSFGRVCYADIESGKEIPTSMQTPGRVRSLAADKSGRYVMAAAGRGRARVWDSDTAKVTDMAPAPVENLTSVALSPCRPLLVAIGGEEDPRSDTTSGTRWIAWHTRTGKLMCSADAPKPVRAHGIAAYDGHRVVTVETPDKLFQVCRYDGASRQREALRDFEKGVRVQLAPGGRYAVSYSGAEEIEVSDLSAQRSGAVIRYPLHDSWDVAVSENGRFVVANSSGTALRVLDPIRGWCEDAWCDEGALSLLAAPVVDGRIQAMYISKHCLQAAGTEPGADPECALAAVDLTSGARTELGHFGPDEYTKLVVRDDGQLIANTGVFATAWTVSTVPKRRARMSLPRPVSGTDFVFAAGGAEHAATLDSTNEKLHVFRLSAGEGPTRAPHSAMRNIAYSPDGKTVVSCARDGTVTLWDPVRGERLRDFESHDSYNLAVRFIEDGQRVGAVHNAPRALYEWVEWDVSTGRIVHRVGIRDLLGAVLPHGDAIAGSGYKRTRPVGLESRPVVLLYGRDGTRKKDFGIPTNVLYPQDFDAFAGSTDGRFLAVGTAQGAVGLLDLRTNEDLRWLRKPFSSNAIERTGVTSIAFASDGDLIVTGHRDGAITRWSGRSERSLGSLSAPGGGTDSVRALDIDAAQEYLLCGRGGHVELWDLGSGARIDVFVLDSDNVACCAFSPDGHSAVAGDDSGALHFFSVEGGAAGGEGKA